MAENFVEAWGQPAEAPRPRRAPAGSEEIAAPVDASWPLVSVFVAVAPAQPSPAWPPPPPVEQGLTT